MPRTLSDVIHEYAVKYHAEFEEQRTRQQEWIEALHRLLNQLREWLKEANRDGVLRIEEEMYNLWEEKMGRYYVPGLTIELGPQQVKARPIGRMAIGRIREDDELGSLTAGRVDLTDGTFKFLLYRDLNDQGERWVIIDPQTYKPRPLTRESFEAAMVRMLG